MGKTKNLKRRRHEDEDEDISSGEEVTKSSKNTKDTKKTKKAKTSEAANSGKDGDGNAWWGLGGTRRITISDFKGKTYINIREYYSDASGDLKPGKKGIMLTLEQYNGMLESIPAINAELQAQGHETADISSGAAATAAATATADESPQKAASKDKKAKNKKANIEATSEEEDDDEEQEEED